MATITKIISGGQTGADLGGLKAAKQLGIKTGGVAAKDFQTELGPNPELGTWYGLEDHGYDYVTRTIKNVRLGDGTVIFAKKMGSAGSRLTLVTCERFGKPVIINPTVQQLRAWLAKYPNLRTLNVAGNRASVDPTAESIAEATILGALG